MANKTLTAEQIMIRGRSEGFTAYQIAKLINVKLTEAGLDEVRPQMVYNMDRQGSIVKGTKNVTASRTFTEDEVTAFVDRYVAMKIEKAAKKASEAVKVTETVEEQIPGQEELDLEI